MIERLRAEPFAALPALIALAVTGLSLPARAEARFMASCSGGQIPAPTRDCETACHAACNRPKKPGSSGRL